MQLRPHSDVLVSKYLFISEIMTTQSEIFDKKVKRDASNMNQTVRTPEIIII